MDNFGDRADIDVAMSTVNARILLYICHIELNGPQSKKYMYILQVIFVSLCTSCGLCNSY